MRFDLSDRTKWRLANKLTYNAFLRLLIFKFWFRISFLAFILTLLFLGLFLPKIWTASPPELIPVVKISGLDKLQAWSLKQSARREMEAGRTDRAHYAWMGAMAHNPADPDIFRGFLTNLLSHPVVEPAALRNSVGNALWLLRLTKTNKADLELTIDLLDEYHYHDLVAAQLAPFLDRLSPRQEAAYLKALFYLNRMDDFGRRWETVGASRLSDPELPLFRAAYTVGWGRVENMEEARRKLVAALGDPAPGLRELANRLQLALSSRAGDLAGYQTALKRLQDMDADTAQDNVGFWLMLPPYGRTNEARKLAQEYSKSPKSVRQRLVLAEGCDNLGLPELAQRYYENAPADSLGIDELSIAYAQFLARHRKWEDLRGLAVQMRTRDQVSQDLVGYSHFLEGWAEHQLDRVAPAGEAFQKMNQTWLRGSPQLALKTGIALTKLRQPGQARDLLLKFQADLQGDIGYWSALFDVANALKDPVLLLQSAKKEMEFQPDEVSTVNHYAAALLVNRTEPESAVKLTLRILNGFPNSVDARINHCLALIWNHRTAEARLLLNTLLPTTLKPEQATSYYLALFLVHAELNEFGAAWSMLDQIDSNYLFPAELAVVQDARNKLPPRAQAKLL